MLGNRDMDRRDPGETLPMNESITIISGGNRDVDSSPHRGAAKAEGSAKGRGGKGPTPLSLLRRAYSVEPAPLAME